MLYILDVRHLRAIGLYIIIIIVIVIIILIITIYTSSLCILII